MQRFYKKGRAVLLSVLLLIMLLAVKPVAAQMKFGGPAGSLRNDAILELGSGNKGLLLPRVTNTAMGALPLDTAGAGMLVFNTDDLHLYIKKNNGNTPWTQLPDGAPVFGDLSGIGLASPQNGQLLRYHAGTWSNWAPDYITTAQPLSFAGGDVEGSGTIAGATALNLKDLHSGGTYAKITYNGKGLVTGGTALSPADIVAGSANYIQNQTAAAQAGGFNVNGAGTVKSLTVTDMVVSGGLLFTNGSGAVGQKANQLVWDNAGNELGIGTSDPDATLDVNGSFKLGVSGTVLTSVYKTSYTTSGTTSIANGGVATVDLTLSGIPLLKTTDNVIVNPAGGIPAGVIMGHAQVTDAVSKRITVSFMNINVLFGSSKTIPAQTYYVTIIQN